MTKNGNFVNDVTETTLEQLNLLISYGVISCYNYQFNRFIRTNIVINKTKCFLDYVIVRKHDEL